MIDDEEVIKKILKHLGLWEINPPYFWRVKARPSPKATGPPKTKEYHIDYSTSQLPVAARHYSRSGQAGGSDKWLYVDPEYPEAYPA